MTIAEEIETMKSGLLAERDERAQAEIILGLLQRFDSLRSVASHPYIARLEEISAALNESDYQAWALHHMANSKRYTADIEASLTLAERSLALFERSGHQKGIAAAYGNIALALKALDRGDESMEKFFQALHISQAIGDELSIAFLYNQMGVSYHELGNYPEALKYYLLSLAIVERLGAKKEEANAHNNIAIIHYASEAWHESLRHHEKALAIRLDIGDKLGMATSYNNIGVIHHLLKDYPEALRNFKLSLALREEIGHRSGMTGAYNNIGSLQILIGQAEEAYENHMKALKIGEELGDKAGMVTAYFNIGTIYQKQKRFEEAFTTQMRAYELSEQLGNKELLKSTSQELSSLYQEMGDHENALKYYIKYHELEKELLGEQSQKQLTQLNFQHNTAQREKEAEIHRLKNVELKEALEHLQIEKDRSEELLLNILPAEVAQELKEKGRADARLFDHVTIFFSDFVGFTLASERFTPQQLVDELHACFKAFDEIIGHYDIEKIKTEGDAYLAVSGLPRANPRHALEIVQAAKDIRAFMLERRKQMGEKTFEVRMGIHSGPVVAGIVGVKKIAYDIWGDTVNTAARMEQNSEAGCINISEVTHELIHTEVPCIYRGEIEAKHKGRMKMYFVR